MNAVPIGFTTGKRAINPINTKCKKEFKLMVLIRTIYVNGLLFI
jgi:hypothetical protein